MIFVLLVSVLRRDHSSSANAKRFEKVTFFTFFYRKEYDQRLVKNGNNHAIHTWKYFKEQDVFFYELEN